ncbi:MAG: vitamin K epoxide reductase family protein [Bdellovibrionota bacterium]
MKLKVSFILVLVSFLLHIYLMNTHYEFRYGFEGAKSLCSVSETLNCESVSISPYSYFAGLPLATWGMAFHIAFLFLFSLAVTSPGKQPSIFRFIKLFSLISLVASAVMGIIAFTMMSTYCIFCMTLYVLSILNFMVLARYKEVSFIPTKEDFKDLLKSGETGLVYVLVSIIAIPAVAFISHDMGSRGFKQKSSHMLVEVIGEWERAPEQKFGTPMLKEGSETPKFTIIEFADFECVHCKNASHNLHSFVNSRPDIQLQFFSFPLDSACNPALGSGGNGGKRCVLAKAVYCSEKQGKGWKAHGWIFDRFGTEQNSNFEKMSSDLSLDHSALSTCIQSDEATQFITAQAKMGQEAKVEGTPAVFVNGKKLSAGHVIAVLEELYTKLHK